MRRWRTDRGSWRTAGVLAALLAGSPATPAQVDERVPRIMLERVQEARGAAGSPLLDRRADLDGVALLHHGVTNYVVWLKHNARNKATLAMVLKKEEGNFTTAGRPHTKAQPRVESGS